MPEFKPHEAFSENGAEEYKKKGNDAFQAKDWDEAIKNYNKAIQLDPKQAAFYSNRAACWSSKGNHDSALADAKKCIDADSTFVKGYSRKGKALFDLGRLDEAETAYKEGLGFDSTNAGCVSGLADVQRARTASRSSTASSSFGGLGGLGGLGQKFMGAFKNGGLTGRMQMYAVVMMGYYAYTNFFRPPASGSSPSPSVGDDLEESGDVAAALAPGLQVSRSFVELDGQWISYLEAGSRAEQLLLLLHRSPLSAQAEFGGALQEVLKKAKRPPPGGIRALAPDGPCHGYSPCRAEEGAVGGGGGEWLQALLARQKAKSKKWTIVASGRAAAREAIALAKDRPQPTRLLLVDPRTEGPRRSGAPTSTGELADWLQERFPVGASLAAAADAARWAAAAASAAAQDEGGGLLEAAALPDGSKVMVLYTEGAAEDSDLREALEGSGVELRTRRVAGGPGGASLASSVASEAWVLLGGGEDPTEDI